MRAGEFLEGGRVAQKRRTRQTLLDAALRVVRRGDEPTLDGIAAEAGVSRATAYRYFPRLESLLAVLPLADLVDEPERIVGSSLQDDPAEAAVRVQRYFLDLAVDNEAAFRRLLIASLEEMQRAGLHAPTGAVRGSYRLRTLDRALEALEDRGDLVEHLRVALVALTGMEALITLKDVCGLDPEVGRESLEWATRTLVEAVMTSPRADPRRRA